MSKKFISAVGCIALLASQLVQAEVKIPIPDSINLLVVNSLKPEIQKGGFFGSDYLVLPDGENQLVFKFQPIVEDGGTMRQAYSDVIVVKFSESDKELKFQLPEYKSLNQARQEVKTFNWSLVDDKNEAIEIVKDRLNSNGVQLGRNFLEDVTDYNRRGGVAAITTGAVAAKSLPVNAQAKDDSENVAQLKAWYLKANEQERKDFQVWLIDQK
ncbi:DUF2057 family protein [Vibrio litoralis]|uniref:DUF2057 family protein n=1 Tax=Vibrio litoralis TaxID=335972 RepID=UPI0018684A64|nr:DUF2057 family protein [Vibrio litoralis]